jgi:copper chaperone CopZ
MKDPCCEVPQANKQPEAAEQTQKNIAYLQLSGINCGNCSNRVRNALLATFGVTDVIVDRLAGLAQVNYNAGLVTAEILIQAVRSAGGDGVHNYDARVLTLE